MDILQTYIYKYPFKNRCMKGFRLESIQTERNEINKKLCFHICNLLSDYEFWIDSPYTYCRYTNSSLDIRIRFSFGLSCDDDNGIIHFESLSPCILHMEDIIVDNNVINNIIRIIRYNCR